MDMVVVVVVVVVVESASDCVKQGKDASECDY
jgi:hypothetical protein